MFWDKIKRFKTRKHISNLDIYFFSCDNFKGN